MEGKKNVVFGFFWFIVTAITGLLMTSGGMLGEVAATKQSATEKVATLDERLEAGTQGEALATAAGEAVTAVKTWLDAQDRVGEMAGAPHTHGNLEAMTNVVAGLFLGMLAIPAAMRQLISWLFILATVLHSGMLYLAVVFGLEWPGLVLSWSLGPMALLAGLLLAGVAAVKGYRPGSAAAP